MAGPGPQSAILYVEEKRASTQNQLVISATGLPNLRRVRLLMRVSNRRNQVATPAPWWVSARASALYPNRDLAPIGGTYQGAYQDIWAAPSLVPIPPLGGPLMGIATLYLPDFPKLASVTFYFSAELKDPQTDTVVFGYPDATPHHYDGLFLSPFGFGPVLRRPPDDDAPDTATLEERKRRM
jgi:hypothetical protein